MSYWLGLRKDGKCQKEKFNRRLSNISQIEMKKCRYVKNSSANFGNCEQQNHAICVKPGKQILLAYEFSHLV